MCMYENAADYCCKIQQYKKHNYNIKSSKIKTQTHLYTHTCMHIYSYYINIYKNIYIIEQMTRAIRTTRNEMISQQ